ncbi:hypothetical protein EJ03DRAFT_30453 [Teratosphaeria nubilosa]|uniref:Uncharacterized protein n=1 Tax=Teratosphaeria nubilosa TaxID=161662 RepID=A0A6G1LF41_9PEZI|nr:hypothetical protein EJ03DRAFT_30453 [Teratosphaeria nubilosa]
MESSADHHSPSCAGEVGVPIRTLSTLYHLISLWREEMICARKLLPWVCARTRHAAAMIARASYTQMPMSYLSPPRVACAASKRGRFSLRFARPWTFLEGGCWSTRGQAHLDRHRDRPSTSWTHSMLFPVIAVLPSEHGSRPLLVYDLVRWSHGAVPSLAMLCSGTLGCLRLTCLHALAVDRTMGRHGLTLIAAAGRAMKSW